MRDLRKKILIESGKTMSRKARERQASNFASATTQSPADSPANSRPASRAASRYGSDDEDASDSDDDESVSGSVAHSDDSDDLTTDWTDRLKDSINEILDRKRSSTQGRESYMAAYVHLTKYHFGDTIVESYLYELVPSLIKCIRGGRNTEETVAALKALVMTAVTTQSESIYDQSFSTLKSACTNSAEESVKVEAMNAMTVVTMFGGGMQATAQELMDFLLEVIESDGSSIEAGDNGNVVTAALTNWGFLASHLDDLQNEAETALEAFAEQLDSTDADVQVAAGTNIALIYEAVRLYNEQQEAEHLQRQEVLRLEAKKNKEAFEPEPFKPYDMQHTQHQLTQRLSELAKESSKAVSKKDRRQLHARFTSIVTSLELGKGPGYSTAGRIAQERDRGGEKVRDTEKVFQEFGYREVINNNNMSLTIDSWSLSIRVAFLKKILGHGFGEHWSNNPAVQECFDSA